MNDPMDPYRNAESLPPGPPVPPGQPPVPPGQYPPTEPYPAQYPGPPEQYPAPPTQYPAPPAQYSGPPAPYSGPPAQYSGPPAYPPVSYPPVSATPNLPVPYPPPAAGYGQQPAYGATYPGATPEAPFGIDPVTGQPLSDKSKMVAGLLQIFLGGFGVGRFYTGHVGIALAQIGVVWGVSLVFCCSGLLLSIIGGFLLWILMPVGVIWPLVDGIVLLSKGGTDAKGRVLRP